MHLVVSAATSQIGHFVLQQACEQGLQVTATRRRRRFADAPAAVRWVEDAALKRANAPAPQSPVDALIHCGPLALAAETVDALAPHGLKAAAAFSSSALRYKGASPASSDRVMIRDLQAAETAFLDRCADRGIAATVFRPTLIYGCGMDRNVSRLAGLIARHTLVPLPRRCHGLRQPVHAGDLAALALAAVGDGAPAPGTSRIFLAGGGERLPYDAMLHRIAETLGRTPRLVPVPGMAPMLNLLAPLHPRLAAFAALVGRMGDDLIADNGPISEAFGIQPRGFLTDQRDLGPAPRLIADR